jgi:hypothetical protein
MKDMAGECFEKSKAIFEGLGLGRTAARVERRGCRAWALKDEDRHGHHGRRCGNGYEMDAFHILTFSADSRHSFSR